MRTFIVDAFTRVPFKGNPAGVCLVEATMSPEQLLRIAQELNLSETAFVQATECAGVFRIRFFSPKQEIPLCGHATLASARIVFEVYRLQKAVFVNGCGIELSVCEHTGGLEMTLPAYRTMPAKAPDSLLAALGIEDVCNAEWNVETNILLLELPDEGVVTRLKPDIAALIRSHESINGVLVTARSQTQDFDYCSRYFWPWSGTNEDPVTGGTQTFLAGYWASRLEKVCMKTYQASLRGGAMEVEVCDGEVQVRAQAVVVFEGQTRLSHRALNHRSQ